jgi:CDP-paratose 2-epimerase
VSAEKLHSGGYALLTGGAGFIGSNLAHRLLTQGERVIVYDNLSRPGVEANVEWLKARHGQHVEFEVADVSDQGRLMRLCRGATSIFHFAAQVAVTTSMTDPRRDLETNVVGTFNVLEALRRRPDPPPLVFTSTNKVYGALAGVSLRQGATRYEPTDPQVRDFGVDEANPLDFHSPYGCSKGAADQYTLDYARTYGLPTAVFRMSCIYGPRQFGTEDQGWVAHFLIRARRSEPIVIFGDGRQVRDILFVDDLVEALVAARAHMPGLAGNAYNIGGGPENSVSLLELVSELERLLGSRLKLLYESWRLGDQRYYVSDTSKFAAATGWRPRVSPREGLLRLDQWVTEGVLSRQTKVAESGGVEPMAAAGGKLR